MTKKTRTPGKTPEPRKDERSEAERGGGGSPGAAPDPEVAPRAQRRRFGAAYKLRIVEEADGCTKPGEVGALLRREGLYSSHLVEWRRARDQGQLDALASKRRAPTRDTDRTPNRPNAHPDRANAPPRSNRQPRWRIHAVPGNAPRARGRAGGRPGGRGLGMGKRTDPMAPHIDGHGAAQPAAGSRRDSEGGSALAAFALPEPSHHRKART